MLPLTIKINQYEKVKVTFDPDVIAKILAPVISIIVGAIIKYYAETRSKLVSFIGHVSSFTLQDPQRTVIHTHSVIVRNTGNKSANNVRLSHTVLPPNVTIYPPIQYKIETNPEGNGEIVIPVLVPKEQVTVSYLYFPPLLWNQINFTTKSDEGLARILNVIPMPQPSKFVLTVIWLLMLVGASFIIFWLLKFAINTL